MDFEFLRTTRWLSNYQVHTFPEQKSMNQRLEGCCDTSACRKSLFSCSVHGVLCEGSVMEEDVERPPGGFSFFFPCVCLFPFLSLSISPFTLSPSNLGSTLVSGLVLPPSLLFRLDLEMGE